MAKPVTKTFNKKIEYSYIEYDAGDFVAVNRLQQPFGLDHERIYQVESFTPPEPESNDGGLVKLKHRPAPTLAKYLFLATEEAFRHDAFISESPELVDYFISYLKWLKEADRFD